MLTSLSCHLITCQEMFGMCGTGISDCFCFYWFVKKGKLRAEKCCRSFSAFLRDVCRTCCSVRLTEGAQHSCRDSAVPGLPAATGVGISGGGWDKTVDTVGSSTTISPLLEYDDGSEYADSSAHSKIEKDTRLSV